eukprot:1091574-Pyramimonas_sp.AAC.1
MEFRMVHRMMSGKNRQRLTLLQARRRDSHVVLLTTHGSPTHAGDGAGPLLRHHHLPTSRSTGHSRRRAGPHPCLKP